MIRFCTPWKRQKGFRFPPLLLGIEMEYCVKMNWDALKHYVLIVSDSSVDCFHSGMSVSKDVLRNFILQLKLLCNMKPVCYFHYIFGSSCLHALSKIAFQKTLMSLRKTYTVELNIVLRKKCRYSEFLWSIFPCIQSECGKIRIRETPNASTFYAVLVALIQVEKLQIMKPWECHIMLIV